MTRATRRPLRVVAASAETPAPQLPVAQAFETVVSAPAETPAPQLPVAQVSEIAVVEPGTAPAEEIPFEPSSPDVPPPEIETLPSIALQPPTPQLPPPEPWGNEALRERGELPPPVPGTAMVKNVARRPFRVVGATEEVPPPGPDLERPGGTRAVRPPTPLEGWAPEGPPPPKGPAGASEAPGATPPAPPVPPVDVPADLPGEASRVLAALLARIWLIGAATGTSGGMTLPRPSRTPTDLSRPGPGLPAAPSTPLPVPKAPTLQPRVQRGVSEANGSAPMSGLGSFLVEVAGASVPRPGAEAAATAPPAPTLELPRFAHCGAPREQGHISRDKCHLWPRIT